jgi:putative ABC transport system permease protein
MAMALDQSRARRNPALALRFAARELRGGLRGFYVFIACIALGVMAIAGIGSVADGLADGLAREGRVILVPSRPRPRIARRHLARHGAR